MNAAEEWEWRFVCFKSRREPNPVQEWFDGLPDEVQDEIRDLLQHLRVKINSKWQRPAFDPLVREGGIISELRPRQVPCEENGEVRTYTCRIYGFFGPKGHKHSYTFLHGNDKGNVRDDVDGKLTAKDRFGQIEREEATVQEFKEWPDS